MPKIIYELHWKQLSKTARNICEMKSGLLNHETAISQHSCLNLVVLKKRNGDPFSKTLRGALSQQSKFCGILCLTQIFDIVLNVTIQKLILHFSIMSRENTDFGKLELTRYTYMTFSGTRFTASGTHFVASAILFKAECDQHSCCKYYVKISVFVLT